MPLASPWRRGAVLLLLLITTTGLLACGRLSAPLTPRVEADNALQALDSGWYQNHIGMWKGTSAGWWQNAISLSAVLDAYQRTHDARDLAIIARVYRSNGQVNHHAYVDYASRGQNGYGVDDEGWWAWDWIRAWDLTGQTEYLRTAEGVFANMASAWDTTCGGGVWWKVGQHADNAKNAISNELFLLVGAMLAQRVPGNPSYQSWAEKEANWFLDSGLIAPDGLVNDTLTAVCGHSGGPTFTYNQGVLLPGLALLWQLSGNRRYLSAAERVADAATQNLTAVGGVLADPCERAHPTWCNSDAQEFKGIFVRGLWWLNALHPEAVWRRFLGTSLRTLWVRDRSPTNRFGFRWSGPAVTGKVTLETQSAATAALTVTALSGRQMRLVRKA